MSAVELLRHDADSYVYRRDGKTYFGTIQALKAVCHLHPRSSPLLALVVDAEDTSLGQ